MSDERVEKLVEKYRHITITEGQVGEFRAALQEARREALAYAVEVVREAGAPNAANKLERLAGEEGTK